MPFIPQFSHNLDTSLTLWLDHKLCNDAQAYINIPTGNMNGLLYSQYDPSINGYTWASPYKSWVYDSSISGATICSGVYNSSGQFLNSASGITIDYINGRVISPYNWGNVLSGSFAKKQVNIYFSSQKETNFWLENMFGENTNIQYSNTGAVPYVYAAPCIIVTNSRDVNTQFALGGVRNAESSFRIFAIMDSNYLQEGINSFISDLSLTYIPICSYSDAPIDTYGNLKGTNYNYVTGIYDKYGCKNGGYITNIAALKLTEQFNKQLDYYLSIMEIDVSTIRVP